ncbi:MAG: aminoacyl-tRNA hydrolase [Sedimentisphaerales bacterium]|nr:aminoacyl-tRNA hydrolase [Sedimentisphaerales bacterium]
MLIINNSVIPESELRFKYARSSGPGGQNVNKLSTKVWVFFNINESKHLTEQQKKRIVKKLATRIDKSGNIRVVCQRHRSQVTNKQAAVLRLEKLLTEALKKARPRKKTKPTAASKERRLKAKKITSQIKNQRSKKDFGCD